MKRFTFVSLLIVLTLTMSACSMSLDGNGFHIEWGSPTEAVEAEDQAEPVRSPEIVADEQPEPRSGWLTDYVKFIGFPRTAEAYRWADGQYNENVCTLPWGLDFCGDPGVIETHDPSDTNPSVQFISPDSQESLENETAWQLLHQDGYMRITGGYTDIDLADFGIETYMHTDVEYHIYVRGINSVGPGDHNLDVFFSNYNPGAVTTTQYDIPKGANGFMDQVGIESAVANSHLRNCGDGCRTVIVVFVDVNNGGWTVFFHTEAGGWEFGDSNVVSPSDL